MAALSDIESDEGVKVLIVTDSGREFCAGADVNEKETMQLAEEIKAIPPLSIRAVKTDVPGENEHNYLIS